MTDNTKTIGRMLLKAKELSVMIGVHERTICRLVGEGKIPGFKFGGSWRFEKTAIQRWFGQQTMKNCAVKKSVAISRTATVTGG